MWKRKENYDPDISKFISWQMATLRYLGIWFHVHDPMTVKFLFAISCRLVGGALAFVIPAVGQLTYLLRLICSGKAEIREVAGMINLILAELLIIIKLLNFISNRGTFTKLMNQMLNEDFHKHSSSHLDSVQKAVQHSRRLHVWLLVSCGMDIAVHVILVPGLKGFRVLPTKMDLVYIDVYSDAYFDYIVAYQILYKPIILIAFVSFVSLPWSCIVFASNQLDNLIKDINNWKYAVKSYMAEEGCDEDVAFMSVFKNSVRHHNNILRVVELIEAAFGGQFLLTLIFNACIICMTSVQFFSIQTPSKNIPELIWVFAFMFIFAVILFIDCYYGDAITTKNLKLSMVIYTYKWMELSSKNKRNIQLFIGKTQKPLLIRTSALVPVSLETFTTVMNWTYKGFAVLNQMKE